MSAPSAGQGGPRPPRFIAPLLAGARSKDSWIAALGALLGVCLTGLVTSLALRHGLGSPLMVAPMGASALLVFAVPTSPLAQPWSVIGGNILSALTGVFVAHLIPDPMIASGVAVGLAILVMALTRCLHPPGGASALLAVIGGPQVAAAGYMFAIAPVGVNAILLTGFGILFHWIMRRSYPHKAMKPASVPHGTTDPPADARVGFSNQDIDDALRDLGETFDIDRADLDLVLRQVERRAIERSHGNLTCGDIMSRDIVRTHPEAARPEALTLLRAHDLRVLPVVDAEGRVVGVVGFLELARSGEAVGDVLSPACTERPESPISALLEPLTTGLHHAAIITDAHGRLLGVVTQTDLLATLGRAPTLTRSTGTPSP